MASGSKIAIYAAIGGNLAIAMMKFTAAGFTGSSAMLAQSLACCSRMPPRYSA